MKIGLQIPRFTWPGGDAVLGRHPAIFNMPNAHEIAPLKIFGKEIIP